MNSYVKIELSDSVPMVTMEYDSLDDFRDLIFFMMSPSTSSIFSATIKNDLELQKKSAEIEILDYIQGLLNSDEMLITKHDNSITFLKPSLFK